MAEEVLLQRRGAQRIAHTAGQRGAYRAQHRREDPRRSGPALRALPWAGGPLLHSTLRTPQPPAIPRRAPITAARHPPQTHHLLPRPQAWRRTAPLTRRTRAWRWTRPALRRCLLRPSRSMPRASTSTCWCVGCAAGAVPGAFVHWGKRVTFAGVPTIPAMAHAWACRAQRAPALFWPEPPSPLCLPAAGPRSAPAPPLPQSPGSAPLPCVVGV